MPIVTLPMYDWPEIRDATDALWASLRSAFLDAGFDVPEALSRGRDLMASWRAPDLLLGQTCGYPYATRLTRTVALVGTPAYAIDCAPGRYFSAIVARKTDARRPLDGLAASRFAFNAGDSQSGFHAPARLFAAMGLPMPGDRLETGSHRASIRAVAAGEADLAAIDAVTWELAVRHEPASAALAVIGRTPPTHGLPLITAGANRSRIAALRTAVAEAIAGLDPAARTALLLEGLTLSQPADYAALADPATRG